MIKKLAATGSRQENMIIPKSVVQASAPGNTSSIFIIRRSSMRKTIVSYQRSLKKKKGSNAALTDTNYFRKEL